MDTSIAKLRWQCRRGMLELDLLLLPFLEKIFPVLPAQEQAIFMQLLACTDQDLYDWLVACKEPAGQSLADMVKRVRDGV